LFRRRPAGAWTAGEDIPLAKALRLGDLGFGNGDLKVMRFIADFHIHSKYSRATSKDMEVEPLAGWARKKGISLVGTGDFTHPTYFSELRSKLVPTDNGLFELRMDWDQVHPLLSPSIFILGWEGETHSYPIVPQFHHRVIR
jgi:hypothetical protein